MPRCPIHHHPCQECGAKTECGGVYEENYDGFPPVICREFHLTGGSLNPDFICRACNEKWLASTQSTGTLVNQTQE